MGGGLVRSLGGWSQVLALRRKGGKPASDDRILGSSAFVESVISEAEERVKDSLRLTSKISDLSSLAERIAKAESVNLSDLRSGSRRRKIVKTRKILCQIGVKKMGYSGAELARFLGVTTSAVNRSANAKEVPELEKFL